MHRNGALGELDLADCILRLVVGPRHVGLNDARIAVLLLTALEISLQVLALQVAYADGLTLFSACAAALSPQSVCGDCRCSWDHGLTGAQIAHNLLHIQQFVRFLDYLARWRRKEPSQGPPLMHRDCLSDAESELGCSD